MSKNKTRFESEVGGGGGCKLFIVIGSMVRAVRWGVDGRGARAGLMGSAGY